MITKNWENFSEILLNTVAKKVYLLGDLFHSHINTEWLEFKNIIQQLPELEFHLIVGNHDIFDLHYYKDLGVHVHNESLTLASLILTHEPLAPEQIPQDKTNLCGHIHPGVVLKGFAKQSMRLPCYYYDRRQLILPAFGQFTGMYTLSKSNTAKIYAIAEGQVITL